MKENLVLLAIGLVAGVFSGLFGIGGGLIIVPALMMIVGMESKEAIGTSLGALIPPVGLLGALEYYRTGNLNVRYALLIAIGLFFAAYFGAKLTIAMPKETLRRAYGIFLLVMGGRYLLWGK